MFHGHIDEYMEAGMMTIYQDMDNLAGSQSPVADPAAFVFGRYGKHSFSLLWLLFLGGI